MAHPIHLKYTKEHEWAKLDGNTLTVGITDHAQRALGDVVYVDLPKVGRILKKGETFGVVESIKAVSDLYSPAAGKITEVNGALPDDPARVNKDPYQSGWMVKLELADADSVSDLLDSDSYTKYVETIG